MDQRGVDRAHQPGQGSGLPGHGRPGGAAGLPGVDHGSGLGRPAAERAVPRAGDVHVPAGADLVADQLPDDDGDPRVDGLRHVEHPDPLHDQTLTAGTGRPHPNS